MENLFGIIKIGVVFLVIISVLSVLILERENYKFIWNVCSRFRIKMLFQVLGIIVLTIIVAIILNEIPWLGYGWIKILFNHDGNIVITPITEGTKSTNVFIRLVVPVFFCFLMIALPFLARLEEINFRKGHSEWSSIIKQSIKFGFTHCLSGVSLAIGIALIIPGIFFGYKYKCAFECNIEKIERWQAEEESVMVSTTYHTMYNMIVGILILVTLYVI